MTRVDVYEEIYINGEGWLIHFHTYEYEKGFKSNMLKEELNKLRKAKFEYKGWQYNREMDIYAVYFELDVIL